jgi:hypothetical protein
MTQVWDHRYGTHPDSKMWAEIRRTQEELMDEIVKKLRPMKPKIRLHVARWWAMNDHQIYAFARHVKINENLYDIVCVIGVYRELI